MKPETVLAWKPVLAIIDLEVRMAEQAARTTPTDTNRAMRDAWMHAQQAVARKLARMMLTGEEDTDAADAG